MGNLIKGALVASHIRHEARRDAADLRARGVRPCLAVCLVGDDPASRLYVRRKQQACAAAGIENVRADLPAGATTEDVLAVLRRWNADPAIHGILVQLPLPQPIDRAAVLNTIDPLKDVDAVGSESLGLLAQGTPRFVPCTPAGIFELFRYYGISARGKHVVIVNRGIVVGEPLALLLMQDRPEGNATVTVVHEHTKEIERHCREGDIVIVAVGRRDEFTLRGEMVKEGAIVIDVGINRAGRRVVGDVEFDEVSPKASLITPVPGGVGPCTIAMLLKNTVAAARLAASERRPIALARASG